MLECKHMYSIKSSLKFAYSGKQSQYIDLIVHVSDFLPLCPNFHLTLQIPSERLLTRFDKELPINPALSTICNK